MAGVHQQLVDAYHRAMEHGGGHHGHNMHLFHRDWHRTNRDPSRAQFPPRPDAAWGMDLTFGGNFLQMHHEMVRAGDGMPRHHMPHASLASWYQANGHALPAVWDPTAVIPPPLRYEPDLGVFPDEIQTAVRRDAGQRGISPEMWLTRRTDSPAFALPAYFTRAGVRPGARGEPLTGARRLADFRNANQLGCCLVIPHNTWHGRIGGAMGSTLTAIADPIFYWGVHWHIDTVFDDFKRLQEERLLIADGRFAAAPSPLRGVEERPIPDRFSDEDRDFIERALAASREFHRPLDDI